MRGAPFLLLCALFACSRAGSHEESTGHPSTVSPSAVAASPLPASAAPPAGTATPPASTASPDPVTASAPPVSPYDLAADLSRRTADARALFGESTRLRVEGDTFLLVAADAGPAFDLGTALAHRALAAYFNNRFSKHPARAVTVFLFSSPEAYRAFCARRYAMDCSGFFGFYRRTSREMVVDFTSNAVNGAPTLTHEMVHPIVEADFPGAPAWIDEGLGALFESPVFPRPGEVHGTTNWRLARLKAALRSPGERGGVRLDALFGMTNDDWVKGDEKLHYALARFVCQWLDAKGWLWPFYTAWRDGFADDPTGEKAFTRATGMTPEQASDAWLRWARAL